MSTLSSNAFSFLKTISSIGFFSWKTFWKTKIWQKPVCPTVITSSSKKSYTFFYIRLLVFYIASRLCILPDDNLSSRIFDHFFTGIFKLQLCNNELYKYNIPFQSKSKLKKKPQMRKFSILFLGWTLWIFVILYVFVWGEHRFFGFKSQISFFNF